MENIKSEINRKFQEGCDSILNFAVSDCGSIKPISYKTLRGFIKILKQQNKILKKHNIKAKFDIILPIS